MKFYQLLFLATCLSLLACHQSAMDEAFKESGASYSNYIQDDSEFDQAEQSYAPPRTAEPAAPPSPMLIKTGSVDIEVDALDKYRAQLNAGLKQFNATILNEATHGNDFAHYSNLTIKIPVEKFEAFVSFLESGKGKMIQKNLNAKDVTEEFLDLEIRLENKLAYLEQYRLILKKAKTIKEVLEVQRHIRDIEEEIDSKKGRIKYLKTSAAMSTLMLNISENKPQLAVIGYFGNLSEAFQKGFNSLKGFSLLMVFLWPLWIFLSLAYLWYRRSKI